MESSKVTSSVAEKPIQEGEKQAGRSQVHHLRLKSPWIEASIWTDNMLMALDNGVKGGKWFSLIDKVGKPQNLLSAWEDVRKNKGAAGVDQITTTKFEKKKMQYLAEIKTELEEGTYLPLAIRRKEIPKGGGKMRPLGSNR